MVVVGSVFSLTAPFSRDDGLSSSRARRRTSLLRMLQYPSLQYRLLRRHSGLCQHSKLYCVKPNINTRTRQKRTVYEN
jgi:hypothetical protein